VRGLAAALWLLVLLPCPVAAHAVLVEAQPAAGQQLDQAPAELTLRFSEPVVPISLRLLDTRGAQLSGTGLEPRGDTLVLRPRGLLPQGAYLLSYRVTSIDGHPVGAAIRFGIGVPASAGTSDAKAGARWPTAAARWLVYLTALAAAGLGMFMTAVRPPEPLGRRAHRVLAALAPLGMVAVLLRFGTAGLDLTGLPLAALGTAEPWLAAARTTLAQAAAACALGLLLLGAGRRLLLVPGAVVVAASFALTGHAAAAEPVWLTRPALALHVLCAAFWLGSLAPLLWSLRLPTAEARCALQRFSAAAVTAVAALLLAGGILAWVQLGASVPALWQTGYGLRLTTKLALVAGLLLLGAVNRFVLTPRLDRSTAQRWFRRSLLADLALGAAVLAATATLALAPPPRAIVPAAPVTVATFTEGRQALLTLSPGRPGTNRLEAWVTDGDGKPVVAREARLRLALPEAGIEPSRHAAAMPQPGVYLADGLAILRPGRWRLRLDLLIDDFTRLGFEADMVIAPEAAQD
jgi:copper transport protein